MTAGDIIMEVADLFWSWRVYLCVIPAILLACLLHDKWPEARWLWFLTVPSVVCALVVGIRWDYRSSWALGRLPVAPMRHSFLRLLLAWLAFGWSLTAVGQGWRSATSVPIFRATPAQGLARTKKLQSITCAGNLIQLRLAASKFASDHNGVWPENWQQFTNYIGTPSPLYCPADALHPPQDDWAAVDFAAVSFDLLSPGAKDVDSRAVFARCRVHGNLIPFGNSAQFARPYECRPFPVAPAGELALPEPTSATAYERYVSANCVNHLKEIGLAAKIFALDNQDILPSSWSDLTNSLFSLGSLFCPAEALTVVPTNFTQMDFATVSYVIVAPGVSASPIQKYARCRVHDHYVNTDGTVAAGTNRYPPRLIVGHPLSQTVEPNATGALTVLTGDTITGPCRYQWRRLQPLDASGEPFTNTVVIADATNRTLNLPNAGPQDEGYYDVIVWDAQGGYQLSAMAYLAVGPLTDILGDASWQTNACASNLRQIGLAGRISGSSTRVLPDSLAALPQYLGWPLVLICPSDASRFAPDSWESMDFDNTSYVLSRGIPYETTNSILATCKIHGFQVRADGRTVIMSGTQPLAPRLEVASSEPPGALVLTIRGVAGTECIVASSPDCRNWAPVATNLLVEGTLQLTNALWLNESHRFYRASVR